MSIADDAALGDSFTAAGLALNNGALQVTAPITSAREISVTGANGIEVANETDAVQLDGIIDGVGSITKSGAGTLRLNGQSISTTSSWSGGLTISEGTVTLGGGQANGFQAIGTGPIELQGSSVLNPNATLEEQLLLALDEHMARIIGKPIPDVASCSLPACAA